MTRCSTFSSGWQRFAKLSVRTRSTLRVVLLGSLSPGRCSVMLNGEVENDRLA